jgi:hypothetical protein
MQQPRHKVQHQASLSAIVFLPFCFDSPVHATRLAAFVSSRSFARDLAPVSILLYRAFYLSGFAYLSLLFSPRGSRSILRPSLSSNYLTRYAFLVNSPSLRIQTLPEYFDR